MIEITKAEIIDMLNAQDPDVMTTTVTIDGIRADLLFNGKSIDIPTFVTKLNTDLNLVFMFHVAALISHPALQKPLVCHFEAGSFSFFYETDDRTAVMNGIKANLLKNK